MNTIVIEYIMLLDHATIGLDCTAYDSVTLDSWMPWNIWSFTCDMYASVHTQKFVWSIELENTVWGHHKKSHFLQNI